MSSAPQAPRLPTFESALPGDTLPCNEHVFAKSLPEPHWHSRGYLPHLDQPGLIQSITFRLHDSLPQAKLKEWERELNLSPHLPEDRDRLLRTRIEKYLDAGHGACWLRELRIGASVEEELLHFDGHRYSMLAWSVMPNHVHVLIETRAGWQLSQIVQLWKSRSARAANGMLGRTGAFWQRDYFDRFIRDGAHLQNALCYVDENPVKAGLVKTPAHWPLSSARFLGAPTQKVGSVESRE